MTRWLTPAILLVCLTMGSAFGQTAPDARIQVTVADPSDAVLPEAVVTITGLDDTTKATAVKPVNTTEKGIASFEAVLPGRYRIEAEFSGFEKGTLQDVAIKSGDNKHVIVLTLQKFNQSVTVDEDRQQSASSRTETFGIAMTREQIEALSDDPDEMQKQLQAMAGPDGVIRVDGFEGQPLPPKAQIKSIHITRDAFAAENHYAGAIFLDIVTAPGVGPLRGSARAGFYESALDGDNPFVPAKGPQQSRNYGGSIGGTIAKDKSDFSISFNGNNSYTTPIQVISTPGGTVSKNLNIRQPNVSSSVSGLFTYALTKDQTLKVSAGRFSSTNGNQGIGAFDQIERAYSTGSTNTNLRVQEVGPIGRRFFINTRFSFQRSNTNSQSVTDAPTIVVQDSFTSGGAQRRGGITSTLYSLGSDLDYVRGKHSFRTGIQIDGAGYRTNAESNYFGTYTFADLAAFDAGTPLSFTKHLGDPNVSYANVQAGFYAQDDIRLKKSLTFSAGVRYEVQTHVKDYSDFGPRIGLTWAPFKNGKTTMRASWGMFYDWIAAGTYGQTVQIDGFHQQEVNIANPSYPNPGDLGSAPATNRYELGPGLNLPLTRRVSLAFSQSISKSLSAGASFADTRGADQLVGANLNSPVNGVRPDPGFANIIEGVSTASARAKSASTYVSWTVPPGVTTPNTGLFRWRRNLYFSSYGYGNSRNNTDGAFAVPATGSLDAEWGPSPFDTRHRVSGSVSSGAFKNFSINFFVNWNSAPPITIRTGFDDNADLIFNDRPMGVGRNSERTASQYYGSLNLSYSLGLGSRKVALPPGITITSSGAGGLTVGAVAAPPAPRYRLIYSANIDNPTNHLNYAGFSGVQTSEFFLKPTSVSGVRRVTFNMNLSF